MRSLKVPLCHGLNDPPCSSSSSSSSYTSHPTKTCWSALISFSKNFQIFPMGTNKCLPHVIFFCYVGEEHESLALFLTTPVNTAALSHRYLVSGPSDARHLLHATSRLVGGALRRASTGICLTWASRHTDGMRGGRGVGRWFRLPVCPAI